MVLHWSTVPFQSLYDAISKRDSEGSKKLVEELVEDLTSLVITREKSESSRKKVESGEVSFSDGSVYKVNKGFIENTIRLSDQLNIDELIAAEVLFFASSNELNILGTSYLDSALAAYYNRRATILQIVSFYLCSKNANDANMMDDGESNQFYLSDKKMLLETIKTKKDFSVSTILNSFIAIEKELTLIKESVERDKLLGAFHENSVIMKSLTFRRNALFEEYQILGEILSGYVSTFSHYDNVFTVDNFVQLLNHISAFDPQDMFLLCYIPSLFDYVSQLTLLANPTVETLHKKMAMAVDDVEKLSETPLKALIILVFLTNFIDWCKKDQERTVKFEFTENVEIPMQKCVSVGALEQFLSICADTSLIDCSVDHYIKPFFDFRAFLQQHIPKLIPIRLFDIDQEATLKLKRVLQQQGKEIDDSNLSPIYTVKNEISLSTHFIDFLIPVLSNFATAYISTAAFMMTQLRDTEEDLLLSSENFDLETLTENADLERLYMAMYYLYGERKEYSEKIWSDPNSSTYGFLQWASRCNSPLIMSTFSMLLAGLSSGEKNAISVFTFLQSTNSNNTNLLTNPKENSSLLTKYSSISWSTIYSTLSYYCDALSKATDPTLPNVSNESLNLNLKSKHNVVTELGEDSIIYISGFFQVLSQVSRNSSKARTELLESDNGQLFTILANLLNLNTSLNGAILTLLSSLVGDSIQERSKFWKILDNWIFNTGRNKPVLSFPKDSFSEKFTNYQFTSGFIDLITKLLSPLDVSTDIFKPYSLPFPLDLGIGTRKQGIWCYIDYLCSDILPEINYADIKPRDKLSLKYSILSLMDQSFKQLDFDFILNSSACGIKDLDNMVEQKSIINYLQAHPASAMLNVVYKNKVLDSIFQICNIGIDKLNELPEGCIEIQLLEKCLDIVDYLLNTERFFADELIPILRLPDNSFTDPTEVWMSGFHSIYEAFLLNLPLLANLSLYIGTRKLSVAKNSLSILRKVTTSKTFGGTSLGSQSNLMKKNRVLVMFETIDETIRIRSSFIEQFEAPRTSAESMNVKFSLLQYINSTLTGTDKSPKIGHFLLGFDTKKMDLGSNDCETTIASDRSLTKSIINTLKDTLIYFSNMNDIDYAPIRLCSLCMEIILKLAKSDITSTKILNYLRTGESKLSSTESASNFVLFLLENTNKVFSNVLFSGREFDGKINSKNSFCSEGKGMGSLNAFISFRCSLIQLVGIELHSSVANGALSLTSKYTELLTLSQNYTHGSSKLLNFLDILDFKVQNMIEKIDPIFSGFNYDYIFKKVKLSDDADENSKPLYDMSIVDKIVVLFAKDSQKSLTPGQHSSTLKLLNEEEIKLKKVLTCSLSYDNFKFQLYKYLKAWTLLVQIVVSEIGLKASGRSNFILEILQSITPKIDEYLNVDITFAEELVSLSVHLLHVYNTDKQQIYVSIEEKHSKAALDFERLFAIFKVSLHGIILPSSTAPLRSDLYVLATNYIEQMLVNESVTTELQMFLKSLDSKIFDIICHDSLIGEGTNRITSLILLENLVKIVTKLPASQIQDQLIFDIFCKGNYLHLLIQKLKITDKSFCRALKASCDDHPITFHELMYELTIFKTNISFLTRIAQTRLGAQQILRNDIFNILMECNFLQLDADLGFELKLKEYSGSTKGDNNFFTHIVVSLDKPLGSDIVISSRNNTSQEIISYYEIFVPVFQLVTTIILSLGPQNNSCIKQARSLQQHFDKLINAVLKRELLYESYIENKVEDNQINDVNSAFAEYNIRGLQTLTKIFTLLDTLV